MRYVSAFCALGMAVVAIGCTATVDTDFEDVGEAPQAYSKTDVMGAYPWSSQGGWTTDAVLTHVVTGVAGSFVEITAAGHFPQYEGLMTPAKSDNCAASTTTVTLRSRATSSDPWTTIGTHTAHGVPVFWVNPNNLQLYITDCSAPVAGFGGCGSAGVHFVSPTNQLQVTVTDTTPDGTEGEKADLVSRTDFDWCG